MEKYTKEEAERYKEICNKMGYDAPGVLQLMEDLARKDDTPLTYFNRDRSPYKGFK